MFKESYSETGGDSRHPEEGQKALLELDLYFSVYSGQLPVVLNVLEV